MQALIRWLTRWHGAPMAVGGLGVVGAVVLVGRSTSEAESSAPLLQLIIFGVILVLVAIIAIRFAVMLAGIDPDAQLIANRLASDPDERRLLARWLQRTRWARNVGGFAGLAWWVFGTSLQGDILLHGVGGLALGSMAAQLHHVRSKSGPRTASLDHRSVNDYLPPSWQRRMVAVVVASVAMIVGGLFATDTRGATGWGVAALVIIAVAHIVQRRVVERPRPALASGLQRADDMARGLAIDRGLAQPATYCALAIIAHGVTEFEPTLGGFAILLSGVAWIYAFMSWWRNRRLGLDEILDLPVAAVA